MVASQDYQHVTTKGLSQLAMRLNKVYASAGVWYRLIKIHQWRRLRTRIYPAKPKVGIREVKPNEIWHVDMTIIRLLDGTKLYHSRVIGIAQKILPGCSLSSRRSANYFESFSTISRLFTVPIFTVPNVSTIRALALPLDAKHCYQMALVSHQSLDIQIYQDQKMDRPNRTFFAQATT